MQCNRDDFYVTCPIEIGGVTETMTHIQTRRKNVPGLRKPYEYTAPAEKVKKTINEIRRIVNSYKEAGILDKYSSVTQKGISRGTELSIFFMPECHGGKTEKEYDINQGQWEKAADEVQEKLFELLGNDAEMYFVPLDNKEKGLTVQTRWSGCIMYDELKNL